MRNQSRAKNSESFESFSRILRKFWKNLKVFPREKLEDTDLENVKNNRKIRVIRKKNQSESEKKTALRNQ